MFWRKKMKKYFLNLIVFNEIDYFYLINNLYDCVILFVSWKIYWFNLKGFVCLVFKNNEVLNI